MKTYVYNTKQYYALYESYDNIEGGNASALIELGKIRMSDGSLVEGSEFVAVINEAIAHFRANYPYEYKYLRGATIIYVLDSSITDTMCVDDCMNYCINIDFLHRKFPDGLGMDKMNVFTILYHEVMHTMLTHVPRMKELNSNSKVKHTWTDLNIAGDIEINDMMVGDKICKPKFWELLEACYDDELAGIPFETIIKYHKDAVDKCKKTNKKRRDMQRTKTDGGNQNDKRRKPEKIATSSEWKLGHKEARELIRRLYIENKRDAEKTLDEIDKLLENHNNDVGAIVKELKKRFNM